MKIGVIREIKTDENRVSLLPDQVKVLSRNGHAVYFENNAGHKAGFNDEEYFAKGAIISDKETILKNAELLLKVKAPLFCEYNDYSPTQVLFTYLHMDENILPVDIKRLIKSGFMGIAYEWVGKDGNYPLLQPMSILTGYLFAQKAVQLCTGYKGLFCSSFESNIEPATILIIGVGTIGTSVIKYCVHNNLKITVLDKHPDSINERLEKRFKSGKKDFIKEYKMDVLKFDDNNPENTRSIIRRRIADFDIIINAAVRRSDLPKSKMEYLIDREMIKKMKAGSVVCDSTACDHDFIETCVSSEKLNHVDVIDDVVHYSCDHIPSLTGNTSSKLLTNATFPYVLEIAQKGLKNAIKENEALRNGISCYKGILTHEYSAIKKSLPYTNISNLI